MLCTECIITVKFSLYYDNTILVYITVLTEREHLKISSYLCPLKEKDIILLGQALGLLRSKLKKMKNHPEDMMDAWLNKEDYVLATSGYPTWESLCEALKEINQSGKASEIESKG